MTTSKKMEDYLNKLIGRRPTTKNKNGRLPQQKMEDEIINQNQPNWL